MRNSLISRRWYLDIVTSLYDKERDATDAVKDVPSKAFRLIIAHENGLVKLKNSLIVKNCQKSFPGDPYVLPGAARGLRTGSTFPLTPQRACAIIILLLLPNQPVMFARRQMG